MTGRLRKDFIGHRLKAATLYASNATELLNIKKKSWFFDKNFKFINCSSKMRQQMVKVIIRCTNVKDIL